MPISDIYLGRASLGGTALSSAVPLLSVYGTSTKRLWITGVRVNIVTTSAVAGNNVLFQLARSGVANTATNNGIGIPHDFSAPASLGNTATSWSTAPTIGTVLWEQELPMTTGSSWEEFPPAGYEWGVSTGGPTGAATSGIHLFVTQSTAVAGTYNLDLVWSE